jgi:hypothetical protein
MTKKQQFKQEAEGVSKMFEEMIIDYLRNVLHAAASDGTVAAERFGQRQAKKLARELCKICFQLVETAASVGGGSGAAATMGQVGKRRS